MQRELTAKKRESNHDLLSKLIEGVLSAAALFLAWLTVVMSIRPIEHILGSPGVLVYVFVLLAASMISLQQALILKHREVERAWYGVIGGFLSWAVAEVCSYLGVPILPDPANIVLMIMGALIVALLWRNGLSAGGRFFFLTFLLGWSVRLLVFAQMRLADLSPVFTLLYRATGILSVIAAVLVLGWILMITKQRIQRVYGALALWFLFSMALYIFSGSLY